MGKPHARNPTQNPIQNPTPNRPEPRRTIQRLRTAPCLQALRSARDTWRAHGPLSEETAHTPCITVLIIKGGPGRHYLSVGKSHPTPTHAPTRAIPHPAHPTQNQESHPKPTQTLPNQAEPHKDSDLPLARRPYVARVTRGARTVPHRKRPRTRHAPRAPRAKPTSKERNRVRCMAVCMVVV